MAKDPAVLFYTSDFISGTELFTYEEKGKYIHLLCNQHQLGHLPKKHMMKIIGSKYGIIWTKFVVDAAGLWYNQRMHDEAEKRRKFTESRRNNATKKAYAPALAVACALPSAKHMENGNGNGNKAVPIMETQEEMHRRIYGEREK